MRRLLGYCAVALWVLAASGCAAQGEWQVDELRVGGEILIDVQGQIITIDLDTGAVLGGESGGVYVLRWRIHTAAVISGLGAQHHLDLASTHAIGDEGWRRCYEIRLLFQGVPFAHQFCQPDR